MAQQPPRMTNGQPPHLRAGIYVRVSTEEQAREGYSCEAQRRECQAFARRQGWDVADIYSDEGWSAKSMDRPAVRRLLVDARSGRLDVVVVWKLDRFSRRQLDTLRAIREDLEPHGVGFRSATQDFDTTSSSGRAMLGMLAVFAELEREQLSERVRIGLAETARQGRWSSGTPPFGYRIEGGALVPDPDRAPIVRLIFSLYAGGMGRPRICAELDRRGVATPTGRVGSPAWRENSVANILRNRAYLGEVPAPIVPGERERGWLPGRHPPLVEAGQFDAAADQRLSRMPGRREHRSLGLLSGILCCGACGASCYYRHTTTRAYYTCARRLRGECAARPIRADRLDAEVCARLALLAADPALTREVIERQGAASVDLEAETQRLDRAAADAERRIAFWIRAAEDGCDLREAQERIRALRTDREAAIAQRDRAAAQIAAAHGRKAAHADVQRVLRRIASILPRMPADERRSVVRAVVGRVEVAADHSFSVSLRG